MTMKKLDRIHNALKNDEFFVEYMPTMSLVEQRCVGAEVLMRWQLDDQIIPPLEFIPAVENTPLAGLLTFRNIEIVGKELGKWLETTENVHVGINIPPEILGRGGLLYALQNAGLENLAEKLVIEITERGFPDSQGLESLEFRGETRVAIDDFGAGDSNLRQLSRIEADILKIDKFFIDQIEDGPVPKIVKAIVGYAQAMEFQIIAEGVENEHQATVLQDLGVPMAQGWLYSKSLRVDEFFKFFEKHQ